MWSGVVLLSVLVDEPTGKGYDARDLDKGAAMETIWMVGGEKALSGDSCEIHVEHSTDIVWRGLGFSVQETNLRLVESLHQSNFSEALPNPDSMLCATRTFHLRFLIYI